MLKEKTYEFEGLNIDPVTVKYDDNGNIIYRKGNYGADNEEYFVYDENGYLIHAEDSDDSFDYDHVNPKENGYPIYPKDCYKDLDIYDEDEWEIIENEEDKIVLHRTSEGSYYDMDLDEHLPEPYEEWIECYIHANIILHRNSYGDAYFCDCVRGCAWSLAY